MYAESSSTVEGLLGNIPITHEPAHSRVGRDDAETDVHLNVERGIGVQWLLSLG